ncbi:MAG: glycoside hydrolase family 3 N-terminal domain-containing protein [Sphingomicrobium sp.]
MIRFPIGCALALALSAPAFAQPPAATAHPARWPAAHSPAAISSPATEARISAILKRMTLGQKVGQTIQADISAIAPADLARYPLGSILAGGNSGPFGNERASSSKWAEMVGQYRAASLRPAANGLAIPILFGVDAVHGHSNLPGATIFPHNIGLGAAHDPLLIRRIGAITAAEIAASGIEWTFAPTLAVPQDLRWGRSYEGYSSDPKLVAAYARAMILGLQGPLVRGRPLGANHVAATAKHFLADGGTLGGKDQGDARIDEATLIAIHAQGYPAAIDAGALTVMISFSSWNGAKNHGNRSLVTDVLKQRMGFGGLTVGDWNGHAQVDGCTATHCPQALGAGLDLYMAPDSWKDLFVNTVKDVRAGRVAMTRLDDAVRRILRVKAKLGLLDGRPVRDTPAEIGSAAHRAVAREAVAKSLVLLKNQGSILPIKPGARVLVAGDGADNMARQAGGWTVSWQGSDTVRADFPNGQTIWDGLNQAVGAAGGKATLSTDGSFTAKPDVAIVVFGEAPYAEGQGDVATLAYEPQDGRDLALLRRLNAAGVPTVAVFLSGRPMFTSPLINAADAFVAAWLPGSEGGGVADVLVARRNGRALRDFTARLSFAWPRDARSPVTNPLFDRGYGLSYAAPRAVGRLSEDPGMDLAQALNIGDYFSAGRVRSPWALSISDGGGARPVIGGVVRSPLGTVTTRPVDVAAQEDSRAFAWSGPGSLSIDGPTADVTRQLKEGFALVAVLVVEQPSTGKVMLAMGSTPLDVTARLAKPGPVTLAIPLRCFANKGAALANLGNALRIDADAPLALVVRSVRLAPAGPTASCS